MIRYAIRMTGIAALLPAIAACGESGTSNLRITARDGSALAQALAAAPLEEFETICLNVVDVRVRIDADDDAGDGWHVLPRSGDADGEGSNDESCPLDLAALLRGEEVELAWGEVPSGILDEIRFVLDSDQGYAIRVEDPATEIPVFVPSGSQSGLKLKGVHIALEPDMEQEVGLVFDAEASIREHNGDRIRIRPVIHVGSVETYPIGGGAGGNGGGGTGGAGGGEPPILQ